MGDRLSGGSVWPQRLGRAALYSALAAVVALVVAGPGHRYGLIGVKPGIYLTMAAGALGALAALVGAIGIVTILRTPRQPALGGAVFAVVVGAAIAIHLYGWYARAQSVPPIHDITTDTASPPEFVAIAPLRAGAPNPAEYAGAETAEKQLAAYPDIDTLVVASSPASVVEAAARVAGRMGWDVVASVPAEGRLEATDTTFWSGYKDDVVLRARAGADGTEVDIRSKSRVGVSDLGTNAERIREFSAALIEELGER